MARLIDKCEPYMRKSVYTRLKLYQDEAEYHESQAAQAHAKAALLTNTWQLCPRTDERDGFCCYDPLNCQGRQP